MWLASNTHRKVDLRFFRALVYRYIVFEAKIEKKEKGREKEQE